LPRLDINQPQAVADFIVAAAGLDNVRASRSA